MPTVSRAPGTLSLVLTVAAVGFCVAPAASAQASIGGAGTADAATAPTFAALVLPGRAPADTSRAARAVPSSAARSPAGQRRSRRGRPAPVDIDPVRATALRYNAMPLEIPSFTWPGSPPEDGGQVDASAADAEAPGAGLSGPLAAEAAVPGAAAPGAAAPVAAAPGPTVSPAGLRPQAVLVPSAQANATRAPIRADLVQSPRRVVLVAGVSRTDIPPAAQPAQAPSPGERLVYSRARVILGEGGRRTVVYSERSVPPMDLGLPVACGADVLQAGARLRGLRATPLSPGMEGAAVRGAQQMLCAAGYAVPQTGVFDAGTTAAVRAFQTDHNETALPARHLSVDGVLGMKTRRELEARLRN